MANEYIREIHLMERYNLCVFLVVAKVTRQAIAVQRKKKISSARVGLNSFNKLTYLLTMYITSITVREHRRSNVVFVPIIRSNFLSENSVGSRLKYKY